MEEADGQMATVGEAQREALAGVENTDDEKNELLRQISQIKDELKNCNVRFYFFPLPLFLRPNFLSFFS